MVSNTNQELMLKSEALKKITEHNRDYLKLTLTLPLGNKALKQVHTNQWLFTDLPKEFDLANWTIIADALQSTTNRHEGYVKNRWYIEAVDITVDSNGNSEMKLTLNAFASSVSSYSNTVKDMQKAYTDAQNKNNKTTTTNKNKTKAVTTKKSVINESWVKKYGVPSVIVNILKKICKTNKSDEENVKAWFRYMDNNVSYWYYVNHRYSETQVLKQRGGNCVDNSRTFRLGCLALGVKCNFVQGRGCCSGGECANHQWNMVYLGKKKVTVDTGRQLASWGSHWGNCSSASETTSSW